METTQDDSREGCDDNNTHGVNVAREILTSLRYLRTHLFDKSAALNEMATKEAGVEARRLRAKASGVDLAISFIDDEIRAQRQAKRGVQ